MKPSLLLSLSLFSAGLLLAAPPLRADDPSAPPAPPAPSEPQVSPADGTVTPPPARHRRMRPAYILADLTEKLTLTEDQQKTVGDIISSSEGQMRALRGDESLSKEDRHAKMKEILGTTRQQIRAALTPDQQKIFDALPRNERGDKPAAAAPTPTPVNP
jgi:hypothetical protein